MVQENGSKMASLFNRSFNSTDYSTYPWIQYYFVDGKQDDASRTGKLGGALDNCTSASSSTGAAVMSCQNWIVLAHLKPFLDPAAHH
jgi:hypothetical protein